MSKFIAICDLLIITAVTIYDDCLNIMEFLGEIAFYINKKNASEN